MFRKIRSNRDPRDTLFSEFAKEFGVYFASAGNRFRGLMLDYSWQIYACMVVMLGVSLVISFSMSGNEKKEIKPVAQSIQRGGSADGFGQILRAGTALKQTLELKAEIEKIIALDSLSHADSIRLEKALDQLHQTNKSLENEKH